jgi:hypothetical protein
MAAAKPKRPNVSRSSKQSHHHLLSRLYVFRMKEVKGTQPDHFFLFKSYNPLDRRTSVRHIAGFIQDDDEVGRVLYQMTEQDFMALGFGFSGFLRDACPIAGHYGP